MADDDTLGNVGAPELFTRVLAAQRRSIRTATVGRIQTYRRTGDQQNTADVELPIRPEGEEQAVLSHVPVMVLGGGDGFLVFPYGADDTGLVAFCDTEIGTWRASGDVGAPADDGRLNAAGPVLIPGLRPVGETIDVDAGATVLAGSDVRLGDAGATKAAVHEDLLTAIDGLMDDLKNTGIALNSAGVDPTFALAFGPAAGFLVTAGASIQSSVVGIKAAIAAGNYQSPSVTVED